MDPISIASLLAGLGTLLGTGAASYFGNKNKGPEGQHLKQGQTPQSSFFGGTPGYSKEFNRFTPEQLGALNNILGLLSGGQTSQGFQNSPFAQAFNQGQQYQPINFAPIEAQARKGFYQNTIPTLSERFASLGGSGTARSSGFAQALGQAGTNLESNLAAQKAKYDFAGQGLQNSANAQRFNQAMSALQLGLTPQFENTYFPAQPGFNQTALPALGQLGTQLIGNSFGI